MDRIPLGENPLTGEKVKCRYDEIDELEVKCWLIDYSMYGVMNNHNLNPNNKGEKTILIVSSVETKNTKNTKETKIELRSF